MSNQNPFHPVNGSSQPVNGAARLASSQSRAPNVFLDARAAELKARLLRNRTEARNNSPRPADSISHAGDARIAEDAPKQPTGPRESSSSSSAQQQQQQPVPARQKPQRPKAGYVTANESDIADLIKSITENTDEHMMQFSHLPAATAAPKVLQRATSSWPSIPGLGHETEVLATKRRKPTGSPLIPAPKPDSPREEGEVEQTPPREVQPTALATTQSATALEAASTAASAPLELKVKGLASLKPARIKTKNRVPEAGTQPLTSSTDSFSRHGEGNGTLGKADSPADCPSRADAPARQDRMSANDGQMERVDATNRKDERQILVKGKDKPEGHQGSLERFLENDADLQDWLAMTGWYDVDHRTRKLSRHRRAKALELQREQIEAEQRKLQEEDELDFGFGRPIAMQMAARATAGVALPLTPGLNNQGPVFSAGQGLASATTLTTPAPIDTQKEPTATIPAKRHHEGGQEGQPPEKLSRVDEPPSRRREQTPASAESQDRPNQERDHESGPGRHHHAEPPYNRYEQRPPYYSRGESPRPPPYGRDFSSPPSRRYPIQPRYGFRRSPSPRGASPRRGPPPHHPHDGRYHEDYEQDRPRKYDSYRSNTDRRRSPPPGPSRPFRPARLDLGGPGDSKFFIIKSFNEDNVRRCMSDGVWATQTANAPILTAAFAKCKNVILFFSINKSRAFQGFVSIFLSLSLATYHDYEPASPVSELTPCRSTDQNRLECRAHHRPTPRGPSG